MPQATSLAGKIALVTGGAQGIGRGIALAMARADADVAIVDLSTGEKAQAVAADIRALGRRAFLHQADISDRTQVEHMVAAVESGFGPIDILVNNAGMNIWEPFLEITEAAMRRILDVDLVGTIYCAQAAGRAMAQRGRGGKIINISSVHAVMSFPTAAIYDAAKAGVARLTATMALELAAHRINVNAIGPGWIETPLSLSFLDDPAERAAVEATIPWRRVGQPEDIGRLAVFLASDASDYITGQLILCDGGFVLAK